MRKFILLLLIKFCFVSSLFGQYEIVGSEEFGRIFGLTYDKNIENKLYAITMGNHILTSDNNGQSWDVLYAVTEGHFNKLNDNLKIYQNDKLSFHTLGSPTTSRTVTVIDIANGSIVKQYTAPVPEPGMNDFTIEGYDISESDSNYAIINLVYPFGFGAASKVYYTTNGGSSWNQIYYSVENLDIIPSQVAIHPENNQKLYITRGNGPTDVDGGLLISENGGQTWQEKIPGIVLNPITFHPDNSNEIWVGTGISFGSSPQGVYKSTDGGNNWSLVNIPWTEYILDCVNVIQFNPSNPSDMIILEENEVAISNNGGNTWTLHVYPDAYDIPEEYSYGLTASYNPFNQNQIFICANYYPMFSTNKGATMERVKTRYFHSEGSVNLFLNGNERHLYYSVQFGAAHTNLETDELHTIDVQPLNFVTNNSGTSLIIDKNRLGRIFTFSGGFMGSTLKMSNNHGEESHYLYNIFANSLHAIGVFSNDENKIWASFSSFFENPEVYEIDFSDMDNIQSTQISLPENSGVVTGILIDPQNNQNVIISMGSRVYKSTNGGANWAESSNGLSVMNVNSDMIMKMEENPLNNNQLSIATSKGVFTSLDKGNNWTRLNNPIIHNVKHSSVIDGDIIAVTHNSDVTDFSLKVSRNAGQTWHEISNEDLLHITSNNVLTSTDFHFYQESSTDYVDVYIAASGLGMFKYTINLGTLKVVDSGLISKTTLIYPNPATDVVNIESKETIRSVELFSMTGQKMFDSSSTKLDVSSLNPGIYLVKIQLENGKTETQKLIKK